MKKYKVISLSVGGNNNKIYRTHDVVNEKNFPEGVAEKLVAAGHLKEIDEEQPKQSQSEPPPPPTDENKSGESAGSGKTETEETAAGTDAGKTDENVSRETASEATAENPESEKKQEEAAKSTEEVPKQTPGIDSIDIADIKKTLKERGVPFNKNDSKEELYRKYIGL